MHYAQNLHLVFAVVGKAEELEMGVLKVRKRVQGEEHADTLTSMANLASLYRNL